MDQSQRNWITNFIWSITDDVLRDLYVCGKYCDVILPRTALRRLDLVLEPTKQKVDALSSYIAEAYNGLSLFAGDAGMCARCPVGCTL